MEVWKWEDIIAVTFDPQSDHEQKGRRPALVVSNTLFNEKTGRAFVCPLTGTDRGYPFHVAVTDDPRVKGFVMVEQVKSIDYRARRARRIGQASNDLLDEVLSLLDACIYESPHRVIAIAHLRDGASCCVPGMQ